MPGVIPHKNNNNNKRNSEEMDTAWQKQGCVRAQGRSHGGEEVTERSTRAQSVQHEAPGLSLSPQTQEGVPQNSRLREGCAYIRLPPPRVPLHRCAPQKSWERHPLIARRKKPGHVRSCQVSGIVDALPWLLGSCPWLLGSPAVATPSHPEVSSMDTPPVNAPHVLRWPWWTSLSTYGHSHES